MAEKVGAGATPSADPRDTGENDWGEPADEGAVYSANHTRRGVKTEAERGQGRRTRALNKDIVSRRN